MEIKGGRKEKIRGLVCRTIECLKGKGGSGVPMAAAVTLALLVIFCGISEYFRLQIIAVGVRDALEDAIISVVNDIPEVISPLGRMPGKKRWIRGMCTDSWTEYLGHSWMAAGVSNIWGMDRQKNLRWMGWKLRYGMHRLRHQTRRGHSVLKRRE